MRPKSRLRKGLSASSRASFRVASFRASVAFNALKPYLSCSEPNSWPACRRAALAWTEAVTLISETHAPDDVYEATRAQFDETELVKLTMVIVAINAWNRIAISFRTMHPVKAAERAKAS